jgi:hypothetical protein
MWVSNLTTTGEWPVTIVNQILMQMPGLANPQAKFIEVLISTILALRGRVNYRNLSRYCHYSERTLARQFQRQFDWPRFNLLAMRNVLKPGSSLIAAQDATFIPRAVRRLMAWITSSTLAPDAPSADWKSQLLPWLM